MDYEKPEALNPQIYHHAGHQSPQPDGEATLHGFDEPVPVPEDKREYRGDSLWYDPHARAETYLVSTPSLVTVLICCASVTIGESSMSGISMCETTTISPCADNL